MASLFRTCLGVAAAGLLGLAGGSLPAETVAPPTNIIVVNLDDISPPWFPPYARRVKPTDVEERICREYAAEHKSEGTFDLAKHIDAACHSAPFLDSLAQNGMVFDRCFATSSLCAPSRSALLTGCYQQRWGTFSIPDMYAIGIPADVPVLVEDFKQAGYVCGMVGKWHVAMHDESLWDKAEAQATAAAGGVKPARKVIAAAAKLLGYDTSSKPGQGPLDRGFDYFFGYNNHASEYYGAYDLWDGRQLVPKRPPDEFLTDLFNQKCADFVEQQVEKKQKFLLYYAPMALHGALKPPPVKYSSQFHTGIAFSDEFAGHILAVDEGLKKIYAILKAHGEDQNTLLLFSADNGQNYYQVPPYNAPYRGGKGTGWLGGSHEPLIISWPAQLHGGIHNELVSTMDIFATALDAAGLKPTKPIDGRSLLPLMIGQTTTGPHDQLFCAGIHSANWSDTYFGDAPSGEVHSGPIHDEKTCPLFAWRQDDGSILTYITRTAPGLYAAVPNGLPEQRLFYNLKTDPMENTNLYADTPEVQKAAAELATWLSQTKPPTAIHQSDYPELLKMSSGSTTPRP
jgi:uncharacterized sulfatase